MSVDDGLRSIFRANVKRCHWTTIESGMTERGIPDANYCISRSGSRGSRSRDEGGTEGWIEMKSTSGWDVTLRPEQIAWLSTRARHGGRCFVAVRRRALAGPRRGAAVDELWMFDGSAASELKLHGFSSLASNYEGASPLPAGTLRGCWSGGPSRWDWAAVREILTS